MSWGANSKKASVAEMSVAEDFSCDAKRKLCGFAVFIVTSPTKMFTFLYKELLKVLIII